MARQYAADEDGDVTESYSFLYDSLGRLIRSKQTDGAGNLIQRTEHIYDNANRLTMQAWQLGGSAAFTEHYTYDTTANSAGQLTSMDTAAGTAISFEYDALNRLTSETTSVDDSELFYRDYTYRNISASRTTMQVSEFAYKLASGGSVIAGNQYVYDVLGNISEIRAASGDDPLVRYTYDDLGQLTGETYYDGSGGASANVLAAYTYTYDTAGNLLSSSDGTTTHTYTYGDTNWADLLTAYDGTSLTYDAIGNPTSYYNGASYTMTWQHGRQLASLTKGTTSVSYTYDMDGIRSSKTVDGVSYDYITQSGRIVRQMFNNNVIDFFYDNAGRPYAMSYITGVDEPEFYYYVLNLQGDVVALLDSSGSVVARYSYNAWGKLMSVTDASGTAITDESSIAIINPIRYRGYYYDTETGFYYLQSRYYDPEIGRFLNSDAAENAALAGVSFNATNQFAYCGNNPVSRRDDGGDFCWAAILGGAIAGALVGASSAILNAAIKGEAISWEIVGKGALIGAVCGAAAGLLTAYMMLAGEVLMAVFPKCVVLRVLNVVRVCGSVVGGGLSYTLNVHAGVSREQALWAAVTTMIGTLTGTFFPVASSSDSFLVSTAYYAITGGINGGSIETFSSIILGAYLYSKNSENNAYTDTSSTTQHPCNTTPTRQGGGRLLMYKW